ncbi:MAG: NlpC/P60 family protein [Caloramator sp.]|nr:NlpC/P60 family protein [Caloramator sp.]
MKKIYNTFIISIILSVFLSSTTFATPLSNRLRTQQRKLQRSRNTYNEILRQLDQMESNIEILDGQIEDIFNQINELNNKIHETKKNISIVEKNIKAAQKDIEKEQKIFNQRMRVLYMNGNMGYLYILLSSKNLSDFLARYDMIKKIVIYDNNLIKDLKNKKEKIVVEKEKLVAEKNKLASLKAENQKKLQSLNAKKAEQQRLIVQLEQRRRYYAARIAQYQKDIEATKKQIAALKKKYANQSTASYSSNAVVAYAMKFLGVRYVWGGETPDGFDCSGFTKYVFAHFGKNLYRVSRDQATQGIPVSRDELRPGDLVFFGNPIHHVGIYVGDNCFIHAPRTGDVIKISPLTRSDFNRARRIP